LKKKKEEVQEAKYKVKSPLKYPLITLSEEEDCENCQKKTSNNRHFIYLEPEESNHKPSYHLGFFCSIKCGKEFWAFMDESYVENKRRSITKNAQVIEYKKWKPSNKILSYWKKQGEKSD
jgi:hypothetical protein